jgi:hypothetical protein
VSTLDAACDHALACSKLAAVTNEPQHHAAAQASHENAHAQASAAGRQHLANAHLARAADHAAAADPTTPEGKGVAAHLASKKARASGKAEDHEAAAQAHQDAVSAYAESSKKAPNAHHDAIHQHQVAAQRLQAPPRPSGMVG